MLAVRTAIKKLMRSNAHLLQTDDSSELKIVLIVAGLSSKESNIESESRIRSCISID